MKDILVSRDFIGMDKAGDASVKDFVTKRMIAFSEDTPAKEVLRTLACGNIKRGPTIEDGKVMASSPAVIF